MSYQGVDFQQFQGLNLAAEPDEVPAEQAIDLLNVDLDRKSAVRTRDGWANFTAEVFGAFDYGALFPYTRGDGTRQLLAERGTTPYPARVCQVLDTSGAVVASQALNAKFYTYARIGTPTGEYVYVGSATGTTPIRRWDGTTWTSPAGLAAKGGILAVQSTDNRLVIAYKSKVEFSAAGAPETIGTDDLIYLTPGDGEYIQAVVTWRELVFVFKETKFFVFTGNSVDSTGGSVFNYRPVDAGVGAVGPYSAVAGPDGVYFVGRRGVYKTTGSQPEMVSEAIRPLFYGNPSSLFQGSGAIFLQRGPNDSTAGAFSVSPVCGWHNNRLYVSYAQAATSTFVDRTLVYDPLSGQWVLWNFGWDGMASFNITSASAADAEILFSRTDGPDYVARMSPAYTTDAGTAITWRWRSGFYDLGSTQEKTIRESILWGTGAVTYKHSRDFGALDAGTAITLGTSPAITQGRARIARRGTLHSHELSGTTPARIERVVQNVRSKRHAGEKTTA